MKTTPIFSILTLLLLMVSCETIFDPPNDKLPARLGFSFALQTHQIESDKSVEDAMFNNQVNGFILEQGQIVVENISFDGRRGEGLNDVFFISDFDQPYHINLAGEAVLPGISFDIPQGIYPMIEITLHLGTEQQPAIVMEGLFHRGIAQSIPVRYEYNFTEQVRIRAASGQGAQQLVFSRDESKIASVVLQSESLLRLVNFGMIMQAETVMLNGQEVLLINENTNPSIYNSISARLQQAFTLIIE